VGESGGKEGENGYCNLVDAFGKLCADARDREIPDPGASKNESRAEHSGRWSHLARRQGGNAHYGRHHVHHRNRCGDSAAGLESDAERRV